MCTAISFRNGDHYFGRNLDYEHGYSETVTVTPRNYPFLFRAMPEFSRHYAMIGIATVVDGYPLYYEATNEYGLSMAGLNFPGNAVYFPISDHSINLAPYELIPWILGKFKSIAEIKYKLPKINIASIPFSDALPLSPLHWMISDKESSIILESTASGLQVFENPVHILTNNPPFPFHIQNLSNYLSVTSDEPTNRFSSSLNLPVYSRGLGGLGIPGDLSSVSRFVRAAFVLHNSVAERSEEANVSQFFHILESVSQQKGCVKVRNDYEKTIYSCCCNTKRGIYYYKTYDNWKITAVNMFHCDLDAVNVVTFPLCEKLFVHFEN